MISPVMCKRGFYKFGYTKRKQPPGGIKKPHSGKEDNHVIRVYTRVDFSYILGDFFAKLKLNYGETGS